MTAPLFPPPVAPVALVTGTVMHARLKPVGHRFSYDVFSILIDLGRLDEAHQASRLFGVNRAAPLSFHERDHGARDGSSLLAYVHGLLTDAGLDIGDGRVLLQCYPRVFGTVFNPLSVYFAYDADDHLVACIYEVRNTFGQRHSYVAPVGAGELSEAGLRQQRSKRFYVSPFNGLDMHYRFRVRPPTDRFNLRILECDASGPILAASFTGSLKPLTTHSLLAALGTVPLLTAKVVGGIHWEALRLWLKGMRLVPRPAAPPPVSYGDGAVTGSLHSVAAADRTLPASAYKTGSA